MHIKSVHFVKSSTSFDQCPSPERTEFAFIGRSNVGKSSLINLVTTRKSMAKISSTPGKTQLINHFLINDKWYLVDLPGYGWAKTSKENKAKWKIMIREYLEKRESLALTFVLVDIRLDPQRIDSEFINWMGTKQIPFVIVFTKVDKISKTKVQPAIVKYKKTLMNTWDALPHIIISSAKTKTGKEEILNFIDQTLKVTPF